MSLETVGKAIIIIVLMCFFMASTGICGVVFTWPVTAGSGTDVLKILVSETSPPHSLPPQNPGLTTLLRVHVDMDIF